MSEEFAGIRISLPGITFEAIASDAKPDEKLAKRELSVERMAREDALEQLPRSNATELGTSEQIIKDYCEQRLERVAGNGRIALGHVKRLVEEALVKVRTPDFQTILSQTDAELEDQRTRSGFIYQSRVKERWQRLSELTYFRRDAGLKRRAAYATNDYMHYGVLILVIALEALLNAFFFAQGSDQGLIGGAIFAAVFSTVNVAWSYLLGRLAYPHALHGKKPFGRVLAMTGASTHVAGVGAINLTIAHYRDMLARSPDGEVLDVLSNVVKSPFGFQSVESILLVIIGVLISLYATIKGYGSDDPVPGYGALDRAFREADKEATRYRETILDENSEALRKAGQEINAKLEDTEQALNKALGLIETFRALREIVQSARANHQSLCDSLLKFYRHENSLVRSDPPPEYFFRGYELQTTFTLLDIEGLPTRLREMEDVLSKAKESAATAKAALGKQAENNRLAIDELLLTHNEKGFAEAKKEAQYTGLGETFASFEAERHREARAKRARDYEEMDGEPRWEDDSSEGRRDAEWDQAETASAETSQTGEEPFWKPSYEQWDSPDEDAASQPGATEHSAKRRASGGGAEDDGHGDA